MDFIGYIIAFCTIVGFAFYIHSLQSNHRFEISELKGQIRKERQEAAREESDRVYGYMKNKYKKVVIAELCFVFDINEEQAEQKYNILDSTAQIENFFEARTIENRKMIFEDAEVEYNAK